MAENKTLREKVEALQTEADNYSKLVSSADAHFEQQLNQLREQVMNRFFKQYMPQIAPHTIHAPNRSLCNTHHKPLLIQYMPQTAPHTIHAANRSSCNTRRKPLLKRYAQESQTPLLKTALCYVPQIKILYNKFDVFAPSVDYTVECCWLVCLRQRHCINSN